MKTLFLHAESNLDIKELVKNVNYNGKLGLVTTIQHFQKLKEIQKLIPKSVIGGQVIGCDVKKAKAIASKVDAFLFIGSGNFHSLQIAMETEKKVIMLDPYTGQISEITEEEIEERKRRLKGAYITFLHADKIGILVSTKEGQNRQKEALKLKDNLIKKNKKAFIFIFDTLDFTQLNNFTDIDCWVNTACLRMAIEDYSKFSKPIINLDDLNKMK
ncbi:MAG: 2-(3-amino-3-carboxypropyl)histidine synthase subunit [Nanoarchaeota archaeon]|nr:2-(3-amino-3-carboxypropyl)histidine synthase subunit [Nanoarchaeota archaeon]MBU4242472.1 2-(3-amino-3-carboxypropyl)histidine synthase subunit [Nanoarchaeota archaeon]MBU4352005.1 2-(3-amino-3-carboxypropyl)histidine synthase subunit [Nanoarchaeota archaeon]MBU4456808.1 2-(3-amino-3-carboxypropyl)histidine synthase subunit [Nanoarchaeota archaeon]MCG2719390.1 2-(3-amino-3-carboxypropyl)histidine synthase subunit [Nanoarchaeota archaeon]